MKFRRPKIGLPLLTKELTELANRQRTYVVRFLYAAGLFIGGMFTIYSTLGGEAGDVRLGVGREIFRELVELQFWLILIFLPATASGALTIEKERDSLALLLLTTMPPWSILIQKFLSRLTPMFSFLLLAFPLLAVAYSYGGVATGELVASIVLLLLFAAQVCAVAVMCSAYCRTTPEALILTYCVLVVLFIVPPMWPPHLFAMIRNSGQQMGIYPLVMMGLVTVGGVIAVSLVLGRVFLQSRAFVPPRNVLLQAFQWLDRLFVQMNSVTGGIVLVNDAASLPEDRPIAWRETAKKSLGTVRYLFRVCTALELPILFVGASINITTVRTNSAMSALLFVLWGISAVMICVHASGVITSERSRQTLDVLLATPLSGADLLQQKMAGVWRLIAVLLVPFASIGLFQLWFRGFHIIYVLGFTATIGVFLPLIAWLALGIGLRIRSAIKAILVSVGILVGACVVPYVLVLVLGQLLGQLPAEPLADILLPLSPSHLLVLLEAVGVGRDQTSGIQYALSLVSFGVYAALLWFVRRDCLQNADRLLQRVPEGPLEQRPVYSPIEREAAVDDSRLAAEAV
jgi:ABC-type transport system involved in multi-copper enzyme maturation permease subunit